MGKKIAIFIWFAVNDIFFCIFSNLVSVELQKLLQTKAGEEKASTIENVMNMLGGDSVKEKISNGIIPIICSKLQEKMPASMQDKMEERGLKCEVEIRSDTEQADFFFSFISSD